MGDGRQIKYLPELDIVLVVTFGRYILGQEIDTLKQALEVAQCNNCKHLLFDHRNATVEVKTLEGYDRPSVYEDIGFDRSVKLASLVNMVDEGLKFYETVCYNRGWQMKVFGNYETALAWLTGVSPIITDQQ